MVQAASWLEWMEICALDRQGRIAQLAHAMLALIQPFVRLDGDGIEKVELEITRLE